MVLRVVVRGVIQEFEYFEFWGVEYLLGIANYTDTD